MENETSSGILRNLSGMVLLLPFLAGVASASEALSQTNQEVRYQDTAVDIKLDLKEGDRLFVSGINGSVRLVAAQPGQPSVLKARKSLSSSRTSAQNNSEISAQFDALGLGVRREGSSVYIEARGPESKTDWENWLGDSGPELSIEIESLSVPADINLRNGVVALKQWKHSATINVVSGQIQAHQTEGKLNFQIQRGTTKLESHKGAVAVDSYAAKLVVQDLEGDLDLTNFGGESHLANVRGNVEMRVHTGSTTLAKSSGSMEFINGRGSLNVDSFEGPVRGQTDSGAVNLAYLGEAEISIESDQGAVAVRAPSSSGAFVKLASEGGSIYAPKSVAQTSVRSGRSPSSQSGVNTASGRLAGEGSKGRIEIRSKNGGIRIR